MKEPDVEEITGRHARPDHGFLKVPEIDDNMPGSGHCETPSESAYKEGQNVGQTLRRKSSVMGPLGKLWKALDEARRSANDKMIKVKDILSVTEQTVVLVGHWAGKHCCPICKEVRCYDSPDFSQWCKEDPMEIRSPLRGQNQIIWWGFPGENGETRERKVWKVQWTVSPENRDIGADSSHKGLRRPFKGGASKEPWHPTGGEYNQESSQGASRGSSRGPTEDPAMVAITPGAEEDGKQPAGMYLTFSVACRPQEIQALDISKYQELENKCKENNTWKVLSNMDKIE